MSQFTKSFLWRFILDIILLGIFVRLMRHYLGDSVKKYGNLFIPFLIIEAVVVSVINYAVYLFITLLEYRRYFKH